ncbi:hypothetical protein [Nocardiopsis sp. Huas11]|uniref:hypothetical protein n=1 Tax=Nocardiopsis sp. Huas11 TaxID=2183912 RepID=UPI000EAC593B|nr:hypothetical protein [Nocardiopsis sp. Huas11]
MAWTWRYLDADGAHKAEEELPAESFTSRGDAESWMGENWQELAEGGVVRVVLAEDGEETYTMSLEPTG